MRYLAFALVLIAPAAAAYDCEREQEGAASIMEARQSGEHPEEVIESAVEDGAQEEAAERVTQVAFQRPRGETERERQEAVEQFGQEAYINCRRRR